MTFTAGQIVEELCGDTPVPMTIEEFLAAHARHTLVILATEVMAVTHSCATVKQECTPSCSSGEQNLGCQSCGVFGGPSIDGDDVRYGA